MENATQPKRRRRGRRGHGQSDAQIHQAALAHINQTMAFSGFQAANWSSRRGYIWWPELDSRKELSPFAHTEILRKSRWLREHNGLAERICSGLADLIGFLTPVAATLDEEWNELAEDAWNDRAEEAAVLDNGGRYSARLLQIEMNRTAFGDGDLLLPISSDNPSGGLRISLYEAHQLKTPEGLSEAQEKSWFHGVRIDKFRRAREFGLADADDKASVARIDATGCLHYQHCNRPGRVRQPSILARATPHLIDITEIVADFKLAVKIAGRQGFFIKNTIPSGHAGARAMTTGLRDETRTRTKEDGTTETVTQKVEDFFDAAGGIANLPVGSDVTVLQDQRPHPNQLALLQHLIRDIAWGAGVSPDLVWDLSNLRGANNRLANADLGRWISQRLLTQRAAMKRLWTTFVAKEMEAGRLRPCRDLQWWKHTFIPQASLTADKGREGQLNIELVRNRLRSLATHFGEEGGYWLREIRQIAKESRKLAELGIAIADIAPAPTAPPQQGPPFDDSEPDLTD